MTLTLPLYIEAANIVDERIRFAWVNSDTQIAEGDTDSDLVDRLSQLSQRANVAYSVALSEWILGRFRMFPGLGDAFQYVEASWATPLIFDIVELYGRIFRTRRDGKIPSWVLFGLPCGGFSRLSDRW